MRGDVLHPLAIDVDLAAVAQRFEELERGLRALAVPVLDRSGQAVGAINLSTHSTRTTRNEMREHFLPELDHVAGQVSSMIV